MNTATLSPPPRPPRNGDVRSMAGPDDGGNFGRHFKLRRWFRRLLKAAVLLLLAFATGQLLFILFQAIRLRLFN